jgi:phage portal protein BeeE
MELLAARRFAIEEAARLYGVPPMIVGDLSHGSFTNSETLIRVRPRRKISRYKRVDRRAGKRVWYRSDIGNASEGKLLDDQATNDRCAASSSRRHESLARTAGFSHLRFSQQ